jgi:hypothetical protein
LLALLNNPESVVFEPILNDLDTVISGPVVDENDFEVLKRLREHAIQCLGDVPGPVVHADRDGDCRV